MPTQVCVIGTVATEPKFTKAAEKTTFCSFRLACNERRYDAEKKAWVDSDTSWYTINSFRGLAEHAHASFNKGDRVLVSGRLRMRDWTTDEKSGTSVIVDAEALGHDLRWGTSTFSKVVTVPAEQSGTAPQNSLQQDPSATGSWADPHEGALRTATGASPHLNSDTAAATPHADGHTNTSGEVLSADGFTPADDLEPVIS